MTAPDADRPRLPDPRRPGHYSLALVCLGNICRSPTAHVVLAAQVASAGLADRVVVASAGTGGWHVGDPMDSRAAATLTAAGYDPSTHRARQYAAGWAHEHDLVLAMDAANLADLRELAEGDTDIDPDPDPDPDGTTDRIRLFGDFDPDVPGAEVPDPYYGGTDGFQEVLAMVERTCEVLTAQLSDLLDDRLSDPGSAR